MTATNPIPFDPDLLQRYSIIRRTPLWNEVKESMARLEPLLQPSANPYDQMDLDRDNVFGFVSNLQNSRDSIACAICLAAHLARFSKAKGYEQRLNVGFQALSTGLDLASLPETETKSELQRCARAAFPNLKFEFPRLTAQVSAPEPQRAQVAEAEIAPQSVSSVDVPETAHLQRQDPQAQATASVPATSHQPVQDPWRSAVEQALASISIMDPLNMEDVVQRATDSWHARLSSFLMSSSGQPEVPPDIDYLRCRAANRPLGTVLSGRVRNVSLLDWNEAYVSGMSLTGVPAPVPLWFALAALGALGFDVPRDIVLGKNVAESNAAASFVSTISTTTNPKRGLIILRLTAGSQTDKWKISPFMPALILRPEDFIRESKVNLLPYFQVRLHGVLIEMARDEQPAEAQARVSINTVRERLPSVPIGFLMSAPNENAGKMVNGAVAVNPADAFAAYTQAFASTPSPPA